MHFIITPDSDFVIESYNSTVLDNHRHKRLLELGTIMNWNIVNKIRRLSIQLSIVNLGLLALVAFSVFYMICFVYPGNVDFYQQSLRPIMNMTLDDTQLTLVSRENKNLTETINVLYQEKKVLEEIINLYQNGKKELINSLETEKEIHRKTNATLIEKMKLLMKQEMEQQYKNQTQFVTKQCQQDLETHLKANNNVTTFDRKLFNYMSTLLRDTPYPGVDNYTRYTVALLGMLPLAGIEPLKPEYGPVINNVTSFRFPITIATCQNVTTAANRSVFVAVVSAPGNFDRRNTIRQTWRKHLKTDYHKSLMETIGFAFILGLTDHNQTQKQIEEENQTYKDIIQIDVVDFYRNLSLKVAGLFNWLYKNCRNVDFLFKVDDDVYVNVRNLAHFVQSHNRSDQSIYGNSASNFFPARGGKWGLTVEEWPWKDFPRYFYGPGVIFPGNTIVSLLAAFQTTPMMPIDDLYYSGICSEKAGIKIRWSTWSTGVMVMGQPAVPNACDLRRFISWLTVSNNHMNNSHVVTGDFYHNRTQCIVTTSNGTNTTVDYIEHIQFDFN